MTPASKMPRPGKSFPSSKATGELGMAIVAEVVFRAGSIFRPMPESTDLGVDGYIEFVEDQVATGLLVGVQVKTGESYRSGARGSSLFRVTVDQSDLNYWNSQPIPTVLIVCHPQEQVAGWIDITGYIRRHGGCLEQPTTTLTVDPASQPFTHETLQRDFKATFRIYRSEAEIFEFADLMVSHDPNDVLRGCFGLLSHDRSRLSRLACNLLLQHVFSFHGGVRATATDALSRYLPHPEVGYNPPPEARIFLLEALRGFGAREIEQLLETAWLDEENLMQRGSVGQCAGVIITHVPLYEAFLCQIVTDPTKSIKARWGAIALAEEFGLEDVIRHVAQNLDRVQWGEAREGAEWASERYAEIESERCDLQEVVHDLGYGATILEGVLRDAGLHYLLNNETIIAGIFQNTTSREVQCEAGQALVRVSKWRFPPEQHMERLL